MPSHDTTNSTLSLARAAAQLGVELTGEDVIFSRISINTRTLQPGDLFVAIKGENFDAHQFIEQAVEKGACGLVVESDIHSTLPMIRVEDTRLALGRIAALWRSRFSMPVIAVTGSCGKTTVKEMISAIFRQHFGENVLSTRGNLNNEIGVPLTLMRLNNEHRAAVIEMGANHQGEIAYLVNLVKPDVAVVTNAAHAHIEGFGSIQGVAKAKGEIYSGLVDGGTAIINADDDFAEYWMKFCQSISQQSERQLEIKSFGLNHAADVRAAYRQTKAGLEITMSTEQGNISLTLKQLGQHNVYNALAAAAVTLAAGCELHEVKNGLQSFNNVSGRLEQKQGLNHSILLDDTYNANPGSVIAGIQAIQQLPGEKMVILGDMGELGENSETLHYQLGLDIAELDILYLYTVGPLSQATCKGFIRACEEKHQAAQALFFTSKDDLISALREKIHSSSVVLVKGSRSMGMESVVAALELANDEQLEGTHSCC